MDSFLRHTAKAIIARLNWQQLSRTTLVLPSHRAGLVLKNELLQLQRDQNQKAIWAPDVKTLQQLQDALSPLYTEDELMTIVRLYRIYRNNQDHPNELLPLDQFYTWGRQMIADFTNVDASMHASEVDNFFDNTIAAHELSTWELEPEVEERLRSLFADRIASGGEYSALEEWEKSIKAQYEVLWRNIHTFYKALRAEMEAEQKGYPGLRQRAVIERWEEPYIQEQIAGRTYVFVGFNYLLPVERELMTLLRDAGQALFFWDFVPDFETNTKAFSFAQQNSQILGRQDDSHSAQPTFPKPITVLSCVSKEAQAQYVHRWLQENYTQKGQKVGVVICDETMLEAVIYTLPAITLEGQDQPEPINITKGFPLRHTDVYARVLSWLYDRKRGDAEQEVTEQIIDDLEQSLVNGEWSMVNDDNQETMTWQELLILESEYQVRKVLNQMRQLVRQGLGDIPFSLKLLRLLIRRIMENITLPFHGEPVTDIQVMGVLETRLLDFDKLLLLNVEEGVVPQTQADSSFIPYYLRKAYSMQTSDERATVYAYNFFRLLSRAGHSTLLFTSTDAANSKGMSRFIMQMLVSDRFQVTKGQLKEQSAIEPIDEARLNTSGTSLLDTLHVTNGRVMGAEDKPYSLSPSALNTYLTCPRLFCFTYIQGVRQPDEDEKIFGAATIGTFVHNAMQYLYETHLGCSNDKKVTISPDDIDRILQDEKKIDEAMIHAYEKANPQWEAHHPGEKGHYKAAEHRSEQSTIRTYIQNILERDRADAALGLQIYLLEADRYVEVEVPEVGRIKMGGRIDRVDILGAPGAQKMRIIDYKSGKFETSKLSVREGVEVLMDKPEKGYIRQTFIYSHALMETEKEPMVIEPNLYFCSRPLPGARTTLSFNNKALTDYRDVDGVFMEKLTQKAQEVLTVREFPPCEEDKCPKYCPFFMTCGRKMKENDR